MKRRLISLSLVILILFTSGATFADIYLENGAFVIDNNIVGKASVFKDGKTLWYNISKEIKYLPIQLGKADYKVSLFEHKEGNQYYIRGNKSFVIEENMKFLGSTNPVYWDHEMAAIKKAKDLTKNAKNDGEKIKAVYDYVTKNIKYDWDIVDKLPPRYIPNIENTYKSNKGICYDYSALFAGMLRSVGVETKLVKGYRDGINEYHAWNEVLVNGEWKIVDTTYSAAYVQAKRKVNMYQNKKLYRKESEF